MTTSEFSLRRPRRTVADRIAAYCKRFGLLGGLSSFLRLALWNLVSRRERELVTRVPGIKSAVTLRARTSDLITFEQSLVYQDYDADLPHDVHTVIDAGAGSLELKGNNASRKTT